MEKEYIEKVLAGSCAIKSELKIQEIPLLNLLFILLLFRLCSASWLLSSLFEFAFH